MDTGSIFLTTQKNFAKQALKVFRYQYESIAVYREFCDHLGKNASNVSTIHDIPFLPISFFKDRTVIAQGREPEVVFTSSGTTGSVTSSHAVADVSLYEFSFTQAFSRFYGNPESYVILGLLPSYLERGGSSLVYMVDYLIKLSGHPDSGFYLNNLDELADKLEQLDQAGQNVLLIGVTYALLDLIERKNFNLSNTFVMETGGMKGRRREMIRAELHEQLCKGFGVQSIHSEYGMTELLSQAYSRGEGIFECPPWMDIIIRDPEDPLTLMETGKSGGINVIDLANVHSCSFIATQDLGRKYPDGSFEVLGRFDHSDIRGCNLMVL
jgi:phenylacetate-coenzyme A ligase PaaK-like adenylate-forming protein